MSSTLSHKSPTVIIKEPINSFVAFNVALSILGRASFFFSKPKSVTVSRIVKSDEKETFFLARQESSKTESISELFPPFTMKASVSGD
jgi:sorbitol-specific phosphotransferase system component IIC